MAYKIIFFPFSGVGHLNPLIKIANELMKTYEAKVIVYSIRDFKSHIENIGAEYRTLENISYADDIGGKNKPDDNHLPLVYTLYDGTYTSIDKYTLQIAGIIETENPDIVLYDNFFIPAKCAVEVLRKKNGKAPLSIAYWTTFIYENGVHPTDSEKRNKLELSLFDSFKLFGYFVSSEIYYRILYNKLNIDFPGIRNLFKVDTSLLNIVLTMPELQPRLHLYECENVKFAGACITDNIHCNGIDKHENSRINELLEEFSVINPRFKYAKEAEKQNKKLVYCSFGTVFNKNADLYSKVIEAFKTFDDGFKKETSTIKLSDLVIVISLGQLLYDQFQNDILNGTLTIPDNIVLLVSTPQLEILKRTSLLITHCGMNSTSEAIHFGVPMICIPINADQPGCAFRIATELKLGIEFSFRSVKSKDIKLAAHKIFKDRSYQNRCNLYAQLSAGYDGITNACKIITDYIEANKQSI